MLLDKLKCSIANMSLTPLIARYSTKPEVLNINKKDNLVRLGNG